MIVLLNKYPYASGHLMVAPIRHIAISARLTTTRPLEVHSSRPPRPDHAHGVMSPQGYNLGWNLGRIAGAGVLDHVHLHVVPRWAGDKLPRPSSPTSE